MSKIVQIIFNPYRQRLRVLIDGTAISTYGNLQQYMDEPFVLWCDKILDGISDEINGEKFTLTFVGTKEENSVMQVLAKSFDTCVKYMYKEPIRSAGTVERMQNLHRLIKKNKLKNYHKQNTQIFVVLEEDLSSLRDDLESMEIKNVFCEFTTQVMSIKDFINHPPKDGVIVAVLTDNNAVDILEILNIRKGFVIKLLTDPKTKVSFTEKNSEVFVWRAGEQTVFDAIFEALLLSPLLNALRGCMMSFPDSILRKFSGQFEEIFSITEKIIPVIDNRIVEVGQSNLLQFKSDIDDHIISGTKFHYSYNPDGIVHCDGFAVEGLSEGEVTMNVHREGEAIPCASINFKVVKRNRIRKIFLEKNDILLGENHSYRIKFSYEPQDADNVHLIEWHSDNKNVANIDKCGVVTAKKEGICTISCFAERVVAKCRITVKPMLQDIVLEEDDIVLQYGETHELKVHCLPKNALDNQLRISSMDMRIVNILGNKIHGTGEGSVRVIVSNSSETIRKEITVKVCKPKKKHWWSGIFKN